LDLVRPIAALYTPKTLSYPTRTPFRVHPSGQALSQQCLRAQDPGLCVRTGVGGGGQVHRVHFSLLNALPLAVRQSAHMLLLTGLGRASRLRFTPRRGGAKFRQRDPVPVRGGSWRCDMTLALHQNVPDPRRELTFAAVGLCSPKAQKKGPGWAQAAPLPVLYRPACALRMPSALCVPPLPDPELIPF
jgi:hypothetical protein